MNGQTALDGVNVLDLSESIGGAYCTKLLADLGASVILVERPGSGHPLRGAGPLSKDTDIESGGLFLYYGANKKSVVCDIESESGQRRVSRSRLARRRSGGELCPRTPGRAWSRLRVAVGPESGADNDLGHPLRADRTIPPLEVGRIVDNAMGGYMYFMGHADREPLTMSNNQPMLHAGSQAAIATLTALWWMRKSGLGQHIDMSSVEAMLSAHAWTSTAWTHEGEIMRRSEPDCIPCADGWVWFFILEVRSDLLHPDRPPRADRRPQVLGPPGMVR